MHGSLLVLAMACAAAELGRCSGRAGQQAGPRLGECKVHRRLRRSGPCVRPAPPPVEDSGTEQRRFCCADVAGREGRPDARQGGARLGGLAMVAVPCVAGLDRSGRWVRDRPRRARRWPVARSRARGSRSRPAHPSGRSASTSGFCSGAGRPRKRNPSCGRGGGPGRIAKVRGRGESGAEGGGAPRLVGRGDAGSVRCVAVGARESVRSDGSRRRAGRLPSAG